MYSASEIAKTNGDPISFHRVEDGVEQGYSSTDISPNWAAKRDAGGNAWHYEAVTTSWRSAGWYYLRTRGSDYDLSLQHWWLTADYPATTQSMYRLYNPNSGEHFYTGNASEHDGLRSRGWTYEGVDWVAPVSSSMPVYRLYNPNAGDHHYTMNAAERNMLVNAGWKDEGIGWYSATNSGRAPLYREYNPNAKAGAHNYTLNKAEDSHLGSIGWKQEGLAWYAVHA